MDALELLKNILLKSIYCIPSTCVKSLPNNMCADNDSATQYTG